MLLSGRCRSLNCIAIRSSMPLLHREAAGVAPPLDSSPPCHHQVVVNPSSSAIHHAAAGTPRPCRPSIPPMNKVTVASPPGPRRASCLLPTSTVRQRGDRSGGVGCAWSDSTWSSTARLRGGHDSTSEKINISARHQQQRSAVHDHADRRPPVPISGLLFTVNVLSSSSSALKLFSATHHRHNSLLPGRHPSLLLIVPSALRATHFHGETLWIWQFPISVNVATPLNPNAVDLEHYSQASHWWPSVLGIWRSDKFQVATYKDLFWQVAGG